MKNKICALLLFVVFDVCAGGYIKAPAGLQWGDSGQVLIEKYEAKKSEVNSPLELYEIGKPPIPLEGINEVYGTVDKKYGLVRVILIKTFNNDVYGIEGVDSYNKFKKILSDKYGKPESYEYSGRSVYKRKSEFYECLAYEGCGAYSSFFSHDTSDGLYMMLVGYQRGEGELRIIYESKDFKKAQDEINSRAEKNNKEAL